MTVHECPKRDLALAPGARLQFYPTDRSRAEGARGRWIDFRLIGFDVVGRRVRRLLDDERGIGPHEIVWEGEDDHGEAVPSGVYFLRLAAPDRTETQKLLKIR